MSGNPRVDATGGPALPAAPAAPPVHGAAEEEAGRRLAELLDAPPLPGAPDDAPPGPLAALAWREEGSGGGSGEESGSEEGAPPPEPTYRGDEILGRLLGAAPPGASDPGLSQAAAAIAERVLAGTNTDGREEVRITLRPEILGGAEVAISRDAEGLRIVLATSDAVASDLLRRHARALAEALSLRLGTRVRVDLDAGPGASGDPRAVHRLPS